MEAKRIGDLLPKNLEQVQRAQEPFRDGTLAAMEGRFLQQISTTKISSAPVSEMEAALRWCMLKVGMRAGNLPGKEESAIIYHHLINYYGGHTVDEMKLAFDMALTGQLEIEKDGQMVQLDPNPYESFDCRYVSKIMNAYRDWAKQVYNQNRQKIEKVETPLSLPPGKTDWREQVQGALDEFLTGKFNHLLWPGEMYDQVAIDCFINGLAYQSFMEQARKKFCSDLQKQLASLKPQNEKAIDSLPTGKYKDYQALEKELIEYRVGNKDIQVRLLAKQLALKHYFEYLKSVEVSKIYIRDEPRLSP